MERDELIAGLATDQRIATGTVVAKPNVTGQPTVMELVELLKAQRDAARRELDIALKWYRVHEELCELLGCQHDCNPYFMLSVWRGEVEKLVAIATHHESQSIKLAAFCARLQHTDELPEDVLAEVRALVNEWKRHPAKGTTDASKT